MLPYFGFAWLLLSVILFVQQAGRFGEIFFDLDIPGGFVWQLAVALIPNVIAFTCPMAVLVGTAIGISKLRADRELIAMRAAGISNIQIGLPVLLIGVVLSFFALVVNLKGVPLAAALVRTVVLQSTIKKLESPIEPGTFNTDLGGFTMYVREGDKDAGVWKGIFIYQEDSERNLTRVITAGSGKIDFTDQRSELVLDDARVTTLPKDGSVAVTTENIDGIRLAINTRRSDLIERLTSANAIPEEMGLSELGSYAASQDGSQRIEAQLLLQRRITLSIAPLMLCLLGLSAALRFDRGGKGFGGTLAALALVGYYLVTFGAEQLVRIGSLPVWLAAATPAAASLAVSLYFGLSRSSLASFEFRLPFAGIFSRATKVRSRDILVDLTTGIRDMEILVTLLKYFIISAALLGFVFVVFTVFELWRYVGAMSGGYWLLIKYLIFLMPFVYLQLAPAAVLVSVLATYVVKSRQNEIVTWIAAGQSTYRLLVPGLVFAMIVGVFGFAVQELVAPTTNRIQDLLRIEIRSGRAASDQPTRVWAESGDRIYSFIITGPTQKKRTLAQEQRFDGSRDDTVASKPPGAGGAENSLLALAIPAYSSGIWSNIILASDNEESDPSCVYPCVRDVYVYQLDGNNNRLQGVYHGSSAMWVSGKVVLRGEVSETAVRDGIVRTQSNGGAEFAEAVDPFLFETAKPAEMGLKQLIAKRRSADAESERNSADLAVQKRYSTLFVPLIIGLLAAPFALSIWQMRNVERITVAVGAWLLFIGVLNLFGQFGESGRMSAFAAVWLPVIIFGFLGCYFIFRMRT